MASRMTRAAHCLVRAPRAPQIVPCCLMLGMLLSLLPRTAGQSAVPEPPHATPGRNSPGQATPDPAPPDAAAGASAAAGLGAAGDQSAASGAGVAEPRAAFVQEIPGTVVTIAMVPVGGLWFSRTEITWDAYDAFVFGLDRAAAPAGATAGTTPGAADDAVLRPTKPHIVADRGFGHAGYPALSLSGKGAQAFCAWLSALSGGCYRLPTEAEWEAACRAGAGGGPALDALDAVAWHRGNSGQRTHPVGSKAADAAGLHDLRGNVAEWCVATDGGLLLKGGSYRDAPEALAIEARLLPDAAWNRSDPNLPRSVWWLADAPFAGFRIVCEDAPPSPGAPR
jgi:formylglycine-generating enzyme required for sulfatase activity